MCQAYERRYQKCYDDNGCGHSGSGTGTDECDEMMCEMHCDYGFETDENGCEICKCKEGEDECEMCKDFEREQEQCIAEYVPELSGETELDMFTLENVVKYFRSCGQQHSNLMGCEKEYCESDGCDECTMWDERLDRCIFTDRGCGDNLMYSISQCYIDNCIMDDDDCDEVMCEMHCEHGFKTDENGCEVCMCNEEEDYCTVDWWGTYWTERAAMYDECKSIEFRYDASEEELCV
jgi:hypothetical protein